MRTAFFTPANVRSMAGELGGPFNDIYCASKFALGGLTESLAPVLRQFSIKFFIFIFKIL